MKKKQGRRTVNLINLIIPAFMAKPVIVHIDSELVGQAADSGHEIHVFNFFYKTDDVTGFPTAKTVKKLFLFRNTERRGFLAVKRA
jgi:hypothetical protein